MFLSICCVYAAWLENGFLLNFRQKGFWQKSRGAFEDNILKRRFWRGRVRWKWDVQRWKGTDSLHTSTEFRESMHSNCACTFGTFSVYVKNEGGCGMNSKFENPAWMRRTHLPTWYLVWNSNGDKKTIPQTGFFSVQNLAHNRKVFSPTTSKHKH